MFHHIETSHLICRANQLTGFYMMGTLAVKDTIAIFKSIFPNNSEQWLLMGRLKNTPSFIYVFRPPLLMSLLITFQFLQLILFNLFYIFLYGKNAYKDFC